MRVLESHEFEKLGSNKTIKADLRFIAATNKNLEDAIQDSLFRADLFYRLNVYLLHLPPLREKGRYTSIAQLCLQRLSKEFWKPSPQLSAEATTRSSGTFTGLTVGAAGTGGVFLAF